MFLFLVTSLCSSVVHGFLNQVMLPPGHSNGLCDLSERDGYKQVCDAFSLMGNTSKKEWLNPINILMMDLAKHQWFLVRDSLGMF